MTACRKWGPVLLTLRVRERRGRHRAKDPHAEREEYEGTTGNGRRNPYLIGPGRTIRGAFLIFGVIDSQSLPWNSGSGISRTSSSPR